MANCLVAQSGGPTAVINDSLAGVIRANQLNPGVRTRVYGGLLRHRGRAGRQARTTSPTCPAHEIDDR